MNSFYPMCINKEIKTTPKNAHANLIGDSTLSYRSLIIKTIEY